MMSSFFFEHGFYSYSFAVSSWFHQIRSWNLASYFYMELDHCMLYSIIGTLAFNDTRG